MFPKSGKKRGSSQAQRSRDSKKCLEYWSYLVRSGNGWRCECHQRYFLPEERKFLQAHHIPYRGRRGVQAWWYDVRVGIPLCAGYHKYQVHGRNDATFLKQWESIQRCFLKKKGLTLEQVMFLAEMRGPRMGAFELKVMREHLRQRVKEAKENE